MSDPIAAAEAAGKARDIANRFETAVFLIAYGIAEKDGLYEADPHRYPYSQAFRHGMNILAALCAECSDDAEELLPTFNESDFIRNSAASDVREWTARWRDECREAVEGCRSIEIGPLASVDGDYFAATSECYEVLRFAENDLLGGHQERNYISSPGKLELAIAEAAAGLGLKYEMWPLKDTCDILIHLPDGRQLAVDAKAYGRAERLAREIEDDTGIAQMCADEVAYVVPDQVERDHPGYRALCNAVLRGKTGYSCETLRNFSKRLDAAAKGGTR